MRTSTAFATVALLATFTAALAGCSARLNITPDETTEPAAEEVATTDAESANVFELNVGDCLNAVSGEQVKDVPVVPCEQPHDEEVYFEFDIDDAEEYPGQDVVIEAARTGCLEEFESFVGMAYEESVIDYYPLYPVAEGWENIGDRTVQCIAFDTTGQVTGSLENASR